VIGKSVRATFGSTIRFRGVSSAGRAPALQAGGHRFDPGTLHRKKAPQTRGFLFSAALGLAPIISAMVGEWWAGSPLRLP
jgi:hypothetical protein